MKDNISRSNTDYLKVIVFVIKYEKKKKKNISGKNSAPKKEAHYHNKIA